MSIKIDKEVLRADLIKLADDHGLILTDDEKNELFDVVERVFESSSSQTVYVVTWKTNGVGGFDWFWSQSDAETGIATWEDEDEARLTEVKIPGDFSKDDHPDEITDWIDTWWYIVEGDRQGTATSGPQTEGGV